VSNGPQALLVAGSIAFVSACATDARTDLGADSRSAFQPSFIAGLRDDAGHFMGGTELRIIMAHRGALYAGNGYWEDRHGPEGPQGPEILVLDGPNARWRVEREFNERQPNGQLRDLAISALADVTFATDAAGARLPTPVSMLITSTWDLTGATRVFTRDDTNGTWVATTLAQAAVLNANES
jgi:hypothetical protein